MKKIQGVVILGLCMGLNSWAMGQKAGSESSSSGGSSAAQADVVWVMRDDGSKSCDPTPKDKDGGLKAGADALSRMGVPVLESKKMDDGMMHSQVCGAPTGRKNAYKISKKDLKNAEAMGFQKAQP